LFQPKQKAKTPVKRFSCFSQSQPVSAHVIVLPPAAGSARKQLMATTLFVATTAKTFHDWSVLF